MRKGRVLFAFSARGGSVVELVPPASWFAMSLSTLVSDSVVFSHLFVSNKCPICLFGVS
jgi:hypothetical protein